MRTCKQFVFVLACLVGVVLCLPDSAAYAALTPGDIERLNQEGERIQRERMLQQQQDAERILRSRKPAAKIDLPAPEMPKGTGDVCLDIKTVVLTGADNMKPAFKEELIKKYSNRCLGVSEIQSLMGEVTAHYINRGYATTRAYLPTQDLTKGTLTIDVVEGKAEKIQLNDGEKKSIYIPGAFPGVEGGLLNLRDIEQGLDQINRLASNNARMDIIPGSAVGQSVIVVNNEPAKRWHVNLSGDNYGTSTTGRYQTGVTTSFDNLLGLNEFYTINLKKTLPLNDSSKQSSSHSLLFSIPYGYNTLTAGFSDSDYDSRLLTPSNLSVRLTGTNRSWYVTLDRVLFRNRDTKVKGSATLTAKESNNYVEGSRLAISSRPLTVVDLGLTCSTVLGSGSATFGAGYSRGLTWLGAQEDQSGVPDSAPRAQFDKLTASASYYYPFRYAQEQMAFSTSLTAQYALDTLYGSEQITVGGIYSVRGFYNETLANDTGAVLRNELSLTRQLSPVTPNGPPLSFRPYIALDAGAVGSDNNNTPTGVLVGGAVGFSMTMGQASLDVYTGHPLFAPDDVDGDGWNSFGRVSLNF